MSNHLTGEGAGSETTQSADSDRIENQNDGDDGESVPSDDFSALFSAMNRDRRKAEEAYEANVRRSEYEDNLREALRIFESKVQFGSGDLVQWKKFMKDSFLPHNGAPAIVVRYLDEAILVGKNGAVLTEPLDIVLGFLDGDNEFVTGHYSSNRFMAWE